MLTKNIYRTKRNKKLEGLKAKFKKIIGIKN